MTGRLITAISDKLSSWATSPTMEDYVNNEDTKRYDYVYRKWPKLKFSLTKPPFHDRANYCWCGNKNVRFSYSMNNILYRFFAQGHVALYKTCHCSCRNNSLGTSYGGVVFHWFEWYDKIPKQRSGHGES